jgi:hypothetical protein
VTAGTILQRLLPRFAPILIYDLTAARGTDQEKNRIEPFYTASSLLPRETVHCQVLNGKGGGRLFSMD